MTIIFTILLALGAQAFTVNVEHTGPIKLAKATLASASAQTQTFRGGRLAEKTRIFFGNGNHLDLPEKTFISFYEKSENSQSYKVYSLGVIQAMPDTTWNFSRDLSLEINCGRKLGSPGGSFLFFNLDGELEEGCTLNESTSFQNKKQSLTLEAGSRFQVNSHGQLTYGQLVKEGEITLKDQRVKLLPGHPIYFHQNLNPYFVHLDKGELVEVDTNLGTLNFGQNAKSNKEVYPLVLTEAGEVAGGLYIGPEFEYEFFALGQRHSVIVEEHSPLRLHADGSLYQLSLKGVKRLQSAVDVKVTRVEAQYGFKQTKDIAAGEELEIPHRAQLTFEKNQLTGYTHYEPQGLAFTYSIEEPQVSY